jgi:hypothetical protein
MLRLIAIGLFALSFMLFGCPPPKDTKLVAPTPPNDGAAHYTMEINND